ncbi:MAG: hypothetical protein KDJ27_19175 [Gammaproteobacteria bacterium]|nr:hypothetical protein [Gammaproteobacteria bacterium]
MTDEATMAARLYPDTVNNDGAAVDHEPTTEERAASVLYDAPEKTTADLYYKSLRNSVGDGPFDRFFDAFSPGNVDKTASFNAIGDELREMGLNDVAGGKLLTAAANAHENSVDDETYETRWAEFHEYVRGHDEGYQRDLHHAWDSIERVWGHSWLEALYSSGAILDESLADTLVDSVRARRSGGGA